MSAAGTLSPSATEGRSTAGASPSGLLEAIAAVHREVGPLPKDSENPHFHSRFTSLGTLIEKTDDALERHGLIWTTRPVWISDAQMPGLYYELNHQASGDVLEGQMPLPGVEHMQGFGSAITYARRYALQAVFNLVGDEDDDGNSSVPQARTQPADTVDLTAQAKGLSDEALNAVLVRVGREPREKPWGTFMRIPTAYADAVIEGLEAARAAEGR